MKYKTMMVAMLVFACHNAQAQSVDNEKNTLPKKVEKLWDKTKSGVKRTGRSVGEFLGFDVNGNEDLMNIDGVDYMPIYTHHLMDGDGSHFLAPCIADVRRRYPEAKVLHAVIPQKKWIETSIRKSGKITGYKRTLYCFILASDGSEGYINAKYSYTQERNAGQKWMSNSSLAPKMERTDVIPTAHYQKILDAQHKDK